MTLFVSFCDPFASPPSLSLSHFPSSLMFPQFVPPLCGPLHVRAIWYGRLAPIPEQIPPADPAPQSRLAPPYGAVVRNPGTSPGSKLGLGEPSRAPLWGCGSKSRNKSWIKIGLGRADSRPPMGLWFEIPEQVPDQNWAWASRLAPPYGAVVRNPGTNPGSKLGLGEPILFRDWRESAVPQPHRGARVGCHPGTNARWKSGHERIK